MKRLLLFAVVATLFAACTQDFVVDVTNPTIADNTPETLVVGFEDDETRIQLNEAQKTVWTKGDLVSVFYRSDANQKWQYQGETGERVAELTQVEAGVATEAMKRVVVVYPYSENYYINTETYNVQATLPAVQNYLKDSYGLDGNIMISQSEYNNISLKNVCGWLKLQLTGDGEKVKSITLRGNNGEQVAGELYINSADATSILASDSGASDDDSEAGGSLVFEDTILTEVTLDCSEGVELGAEATAFYIALPPQTFTKGITVDITDTTNFTMTQSTDNEVVIERNHIKPMAAFEVALNAAKPANNEIWYTNGSTTEATTPHSKSAFGSATIQSNTYNPDIEYWVITFDKEITKIEYEAFYNCVNLKTLYIPDSVTHIGCRSFARCSNLESVIIPKSVINIEQGPFRECDNLKEFKSELASDDGRCLIVDGDLVAFAPSGINTYTIPNSVTSIGNDGVQPFRYVNSLNSITIPNNVKSIGEFAFYECKGLEYVTIGDGVTTIGDYAFSGCSNLNVTKIGKGIESIGEYAFRDCSGKLFVYSNVGKGQYAYAGFTELIVSEGVETIADEAFMHSHLAKVTLPITIKSIGAHAFSGSGSPRINLPDSITYIGDYALSGCKIVSDGILRTPANLKVIGEGAFAGCRISYLVISEGVTSIGDYAFADCNLYSLKIPSTVTKIGNSAFETNILTTVEIPSSVTSIGEKAFFNSKQLKSVYCKRTTPPTLGSYVFYAESFNSAGTYSYKPINCTIYVPSSSLAKYRSATNWSNYYSYFVGE
jgi:hypothetical protein